MGNGPFFHELTPRAIMQRDSTSMPIGARATGKSFWLQLLMKGLEPIRDDPDWC